MNILSILSLAWPTSNNKVLREISIKMKEKEKKIIEAAVSLFAKKGYSSTSIQEIVDLCEMSKGAFYLNFKSKEALLLAAFKYQFQSIQTKLDSLPIKDLTPRETFIAQLKAQIEEVQKNKDFIIMQTREQAIPMNEEIEMFIRKISIEIGQSYHTSLMKIYGPTIEHLVHDLNMILQGIVQSYMKLIIFDKVSFDLQTLATFILNRIDDLVTGFTKSGEQPMLTADTLKKLSEIYPEPKPDKEEILRHLKLVKNHVDKEELLITFEVLVTEIEMESPRIPVIQGMLSNFKDEPDLQKVKTMIEVFFELEE